MLIFLGKTPARWTSGSILDLYWIYWVLPYQTKAWTWNDGCSPCDSMPFCMAWLKKPSQLNKIYPPICDLSQRKSHITHLVGGCALSSCVSNCLPIGLVVPSITQHAGWLESIIPNRGYVTYIIHMIITIITLMLTIIVTKNRIFVWNTCFKPLGVTLATDCSPFSSLRYLTHKSLEFGFTRAARSAVDITISLSSPQITREYHSTI